jgi:hypothetical protein
MHARIWSCAPFFAAGLILVVCWIPCCPWTGSSNEREVQSGDWTLLGEYSDPDAIPFSASIPGMSDMLFAGQGLNYPRLQYFSGDYCLPHWEFAMGFGNYRVLIAPDSSGGQLLCGGNETGSIYFFRIPDPFPEWTYLPARNVIITSLVQSRNGEIGIVGVLLSREPHNMVFAIEPEYGILLWKKPVPRETWYDSILGIDVTDDGNTVVVTTYMGIYILDGKDGSITYRTDNYGQISAKISGNGEYIVAGNFYGIVSAYRWDSENEQYTLHWNRHIPDTWPDVDISRNGETTVAGAFNTGDLDSSLLAVFDTFTGDMLWDFPMVDHVIPAVSDDGITIVAGCWGVLDDSKDDFFVFRRHSSLPVISLNLEGSVYSISLNAEGNRIAFGSKQVHARILGRGGRIALLADNGSRQFW